jgi:hypothetical protein
MSFEIHTRDLFDTGDEALASAKWLLRDIPWRHFCVMLATGALIVLAALAVGD